MNSKKYILTLVCAAFFLLPSFGQLRSFGIKTGVGATLVDVAKAIETEEDYMEEDYMEEWDTWAVIVKAEGEYGLGERFSLGVEAGVNRLYYWEYKYDMGYYKGFRWRTEWTGNLVVHAILYLSDNLYLKGGGGLHFFFSGGTVPGLLASAGYNIPIGDKLMLPLELRVEPVFGNATPIPIVLGVGIKYKLY